MSNYRERILNGPGKPARDPTCECRTTLARKERGSIGRIGGRLEGGQESSAELGRLRAERKRSDDTRAVHDSAGGNHRNWHLTHQQSDKRQRSKLFV